MKIFLVLLFGVFIASLIGSRSRKLGLFVISLLFIAVMGFRNNITSDYSNYEMLYNQMWYEYKETGLLGMLGIHFLTDKLEPGFSLLNLIVYWLSGGSYRALLLVTSTIIIVPLFRFYAKFPKVFYAIALYLVIGTYFEGFNIMRQMMAASIATLSFKYIQGRKFLKYIGVIVVATLFHITALLMIPSYFLFIQKHRNRFTFRITFLVLGVVLFINTLLFTKFFLDLTHEGVYAYTEGVTAISITNFLLPLALLLSCELMKIFAPNYFGDSDLKKTQSSKQQVNYTIIETGMFLWVILAACTVQIPMITRFASFFAPFAMVYISQTIYGIKNTTLRGSVSLAFIAVLSVYKLLSFGSSYLNDYVFTFAF